MLKKEFRVCEHCEWYTASRAETHGYCKLNPPEFTYQDERQRPRFYNPTVSPNSFCSHWMEAEED